MEVSSSLMVSTPSSGPLSKFGNHLSLKLLNTNFNMSPTTSDYGTIGSPMSHLALNLSGLSTGDCFDDTPKRRLSLSSMDTPTTPDRPPPAERMTSTESGCFVDSPCSSPIGSPTIELSLKRFQASGISIDHQAGSYGRRRSLPFRRLSSLPKLPFCLSPTEDLDSDETHHSTDSNNELSPCEKFSLKCTDMFIDETSLTCDDESDEKSLDCDQIVSINEGSQDSGISLDSHKDCDFHFAAPVGLAPRRHRAMFGDDTCSPLKYSPVKLAGNGGKATSLSFRSFSVSSGLDMKYKEEEEDAGSPLKFSRLASSENDSDNEDDGFLDLVDKEVEEINDSILPFSFTSLFSGPVHESSKKGTCIKRVNSRILSRSQSFDIRSRTRRMKRSDPDERDIDETTPIFKRRRSVQFPDCDSAISSPPKESTPIVKLKRCYSETEAFIKSALNRSTEDRSLIGDGSKTFCLPLVEGKHQDLKSISADTLDDLLSNRFADEVSKCTVVDCRYPYEFVAGHIENALNLYTKECIIDEFLTSPPPQESDETGKRSIIVFHCEFSSERAPNLCRFLRNKDRDQNTEFYPRLHYPELYVLDGGYKAFYESHKEVCVPQDYKPMLHREHREDLRKFRAKSRSWAGEKSRIGLRLGLKF